MARKAWCLIGVFSEYKGFIEEGWSRYQFSWGDEEEVGIWENGVWEEGKEDEIWEKGVGKDGIEGKMGWDWCYSLGTW